MEPHTIEECWQKLCDLESLVFGFIENVNQSQDYTNADIDGCRHTEGEISERVDDVTPYTETKTAYISDTEIVFTGVPADGQLSIFASDGEGYPTFTVSREIDLVTVTFDEPLENVTKVTLSILQ